MSGWCMYEMIYVVAAGHLGTLFTILIIFNSLRLNGTAVKKTGSLTFLSLIIFGIGVIVSEVIINSLATFNCDVSSDVSIKSMLAAILTIGFVSFAIRKREYVFNNLIDKILTIISILLILGAIISLLLEGDLFEFIKLSTILPLKFFDLI